MLSGVLLHVIAAAGASIWPWIVRSRLQSLVDRRFEIMDDPAVFGVGDFGDTDLARRSAVIQPVSKTWPPLVG